MPLTERTLPNGITLLTEPIAATKAVAIGFWFRMGSRDEREGESGITHFIEHLLFKGTAKMSASEIARFFDRVGGYVNAFTERETMCLHCVVPADYTLQALSILSDMVWDSAPKDDDIEHERSVIESEILASLDDPEECGTDQAIALMFPGNPLARPIAGSVQDVRGISSAAIRSFFAEDLRSHAPIIAIAGSFVPDDVESFFAMRTSEMAIRPGNQESPFPEWNPGFFCPVSRFSQSQIFLSYPVTFSRDSKDWFSWDLINAITGSTVSSRLFQSLRERHGLCYSIFSMVNFGRDFALWSAYLATPRESTVRAMDLLVKEIDDVVKYGFTEAEIRDARTHIIGELLLSAEDTENRMKRLARQYLFGNTVYTIDECIEIVNEIGDASLISRTAAAFRNDTASLVIYSDKRKAKECRKSVCNNSLRC